MNVEKVFTPNDTPTITYVDRAEHQLQQTLSDYYKIPNVIVSVSGPSKSGKTVLIKKVVNEESLITISGSGIESGDNIWDRVLNWMGAPSETTSSTTKGFEVGGEVEGSGGIKLPFIADFEAKAQLSGTHSREKETGKTFGRSGLEQVAREIAGSDYVVFIDDFHYIRPEIQEEVGKQLKSAAERGIKIFTASVPHRSDDVVRSNPELRGRVAALDIGYWSQNELALISRRGFHELNIDLSPEIERTFATEAAGSPQLMQSICLNLCYSLNIRSKLDKHERFDVSPGVQSETLRRTSAFTNFAKMLSALHQGAKTRGTERKIHSLIDGTNGDVYRAILLGLKQNPTGLAFTYDNILDRVRAVCTVDAPVGSSINSALEQMAIIANEIQPAASPLSWQEDVLDIADPYLLFYLRCSNKLQELGA
ncbi:hypothetical protein [Bosea sp. Root381]|uniref:hypothetical protein n=1 Tax=Bosea sp. Root381 TaxID=1736524 RepID=UPI000A4B8217|nr:hypothetical protein [Bosea sp. Root381]